MIFLLCFIKSIITRKLAIIFKVSGFTYTNLHLFTCKYLEFLLNFVSIYFRSVIISTVTHKPLLYANKQKWEKKRLVLDQKFELQKSILYQEVPTCLERSN